MRPISDEEKYLRNHIKSQKADSWLRSILTIIACKNKTDFILLFVFYTLPNPTSLGSTLTNNAGGLSKISSKHNRQGARLATLTGLKEKKPRNILGSYMKPGTTFGLFKSDSHGLQ